MKKSHLFLLIVAFGCVPLLLPAMEHPKITGPATITDISYVPNSSDPEQQLDLYLPASKTPTPVVVWIHGGAWIVGDKSPIPGRIFLHKGYAVASLNYRFADQATFPAQIYDCKSAIRWLKAHAGDYNLDPNHIGVFGMSAGGHLAALIGTTGNNKDLEGPEGNNNFSSQVQAIVDWCGPTDLFTLASQSGPGFKLDNTSPSAPVRRLLGGTVQEKKELANLASPVKSVSASDPPFLIMHGDRDDMVPIQQSAELETALMKAGVKARIFVVHNAGHSFFSPKTLQMVADFFDATLKK